MAAVDKTLIISELNKFKKDELIDIIVMQKLPERVCSELIINVVKSLKNEVTQEEFHDSQDVITYECNQNRCKSAKTTVKTMTSEIELLKRLCLQLEKRTGEQEELIKLLKQNYEQFIKDATSSDHPMNKNPQGNKNSKERSVISNQTAIDQNKQHNLTVNTGERKIANHNSYANVTAINGKQTTAVQQPNINKQTRKSPYTKGTNETGSIIKGVEKYAYIYVGHIKDNVSETTMNEYLKEEWPELECQVKKLVNKGSNSSFKISVHPGKKELLFDNKKWPRGVLVKEYTFFRKQP
jgi:hypothetical protein